MPKSPGAPEPQLELTIDRDALTKMLGRVVQVAEKKGEGLAAQVLLRAELGGILHMTTTDLVSTLALAGPAAVSSAGALVLQARQLREVVRRLPPGELTLRADENGHALLEQGAIGYRLLGTPPWDYPDVGIETPEGTAELELRRSALAAALEQVAFAVSADETRPNLCGVFVSVGVPAAGKTGGASGDERLQLRLVATDGHRLASVLADVLVAAEGAPGPGLILPPKALRALGDVFPSDDTIRLRVDHKGGAAVFAGQDARLRVQLVDGTFPDFARVLGTTVHRVEVACDELRAAVDRVAVVAEQHAIRLELGAALRVSALSATKGAAWETLELELPVPDQTIGLNAAYLLDALRVCDARQVELGLGETPELCPVRIVDPRNEDSFWIVMPLRIDGSEASKGETEGTGGEGEAARDEAEGKPKRRRAKTASLPGTAVPEAETAPTSVEA